MKVDLEHHKDARLNGLSKTPFKALRKEEPSVQVVCLLKGFSENSFVFFTHIKLSRKGHECKLRNPYLLPTFSFWSP